MQALGTSLTSSHIGVCTHSAGPAAFPASNPTWGGWKGHQGWGSLPGGRAGRTRSRQGRLAPARYRTVCPRPTLARCWERGVVDAWGSSCEGKPHPCPALFLVRDEGAWPRGTQSAAPPLQQPGSQPCFIWLQQQSSANLLYQQSVFSWGGFSYAFRAGQTLKTHFQHFMSVATSSAERLLRQRQIA